jgi:hypothetical protein
MNVCGLFFLILLSFPFAFNKKKKINPLFHYNIVGSLAQKKKSSDLYQILAKKLILYVYTTI